MKKRLLITSVVMMLVVAVALATSTYAWFTSNAAVTANDVTMKATTSTAPALGISWTNGNYGTSIEPVITDSATDTSFVFSPVAPLSLSKSGTITTSDVAFYTAMSRSVAGDFKFNANGAAATHDAYTWTNGNETSFFLKNLSTTNPLTGTLTMTATITGDGADLIRVGVFKYNSEATSADKYELIEVLSNATAGYSAVEAGAMTAGTYYKLVNGVMTTAVEATSTNEDQEAAAAEKAAKVADGLADWYVGMNTTAGKFYTATGSTTHAKAVYGPIVKDASVNAMATIDCAESLDLGTNLAAGTVIELRVIVWMDANVLGDARQGDDATITLDFNVHA